MKDIDAKRCKGEKLLDALEKSGHKIAYEILHLTGDLEEAIYPESLVNVVTARELADAFPGTKIKMEENTDTLVVQTRSLWLSEDELKDDDDGKSLYPVGRRGKVDIAVWGDLFPELLVEVKDELSGTDDGIRADIDRLKKFLMLENRWIKKRGESDSRPIDLLQK